MDHGETLQRRLEQACARRDREPAFSPDWDAAMAHVEDLMGELEREQEVARRSRAARRPGAVAIHG